MPLIIISLRNFLVAKGIFCHWSGCVLLLCCCAQLNSCCISNVAKVTAFCYAQWIHFLVCICDKDSHETNCIHHVCLLSFTLPTNPSPSELCLVYLNFLTSLKTSLPWASKPTLHNLTWGEQWTDRIQQIYNLASEIRLNQMTHIQNKQKNLILYQTQKWPKCICMWPFLAEILLLLNFV